jgi:hypothetical protein
MVYKIDPIKDLHLVEEFRKTPVGRHSPNLMRILNLLRYDPSGYQTILVARIPFREWILGVMPPNREDAIELDEKGEVFTNREDAEWAVFCARWRARTGHAINTPRHISLTEVDHA